MVKAFHITREIAANLAMGIRPIRNWRVKRGRTACYELPDQVKLILDQFHFFIDNIGWDHVRNKTIVEIGPGDVIPHGLLFIGAGAKQYIAIDRFAGDVSGASAQKLYAALIKSAPERIQKGLGNLGLTPYQYPWLKSVQGVTRVKLVRSSIEDIDPEQIENVDIIISFNVVEHLSNTHKAFTNMARVLNSDGLMVHRVDYGPHGLWKSYKNPLSFLSVPKVLWLLMGSNKGCPNRTRHSQVLSTLDNCGFHSTARKTGFFSAEEAEAIRPFLPKDLRQLSDEDIKVKDAEILSSKVSPPCFRGKGFRHCFNSPS